MKIQMDDGTPSVNGVTASIGCTASVEVSRGVLCSPRLGRN